MVPLEKRASQGGYCITAGDRWLYGSDIVSFLRNGRARIVVGDRLLLRKYAATREDVWQARLGHEVAILIADPESPGNREGTGSDFIYSLLPRPASDNLHCLNSAL